MVYNENDNILEGSIVEVDSIKCKKINIVDEFSLLGNSKPYLAQIATGTYAGDNADNRQIIVGFTPKIVIISYLWLGLWYLFYIGDTHTAWSPMLFSTAMAATANRGTIISGGFEVNNFEVGDFFNVVGTTFHYLAIG